MLYIILEFYTRIELCAMVLRINHAQANGWIECLVGNSIILGTIRDMRAKTHTFHMWNSFCSWHNVVHM